MAQNTDTTAEAARSFEERVTRLEAEFAEVAGLLNATHGRMIELLGQAVDEDLWKGWQIHSPKDWVAWQGGLTSARAGGMARLAERRSELPTAIAALAAGELSVDAAIEIARAAPAAFEESITEFAKSATIAQLKTTLRSYHYDDPDADKPKPKGDGTRGVSISDDAKTGWLNANLPLDKHAVVKQALRAAREDLYRQACEGLPDDAPRPQITWEDALMAVAEASLLAGEARFPGSDRYLVHLHLDATPTPDDPTGRLSLHLGPNLPDALRDLLLCDSQLRPVFEVHGKPIAVGRKTRAISRRLRRLIEHRDGGCVIPGCGITHGLDIHHIIHWEHTGPTNPENLVALCRRHHRLHHLGQLTITGNPTRARHDGGLTFTDAWGRPLRPAGTPTPPTPGQTTQQATAGLGIEPPTYQHPLGERLDHRAVNFNRNRYDGGERPTRGYEDPVRPPDAGPDDEPTTDPLEPPRAPIVTSGSAPREHHRTGEGTRGDPA